MKRQVGETIYGKGAEEHARKLARVFSDAAHTLGEDSPVSPWDTLTVESPDGHGWAVFAEPPRGAR